MKKTLTIFVLAAMIISLSACGSRTNYKDYSDEIEELEDEIKDLKKENAELKARLGSGDEPPATEGESDPVTDPFNEEKSDPATDSFTVETSGVCGADLTWEYGNGVLWIHGTGNMTDYSYNNRPWEDIKDKVGHIIVDDGVTSIGQYAFSEMELVSKIMIPSSVSTLRYDSFRGSVEAAAPVADTAVELSEEEKERLREEQEQRAIEYARENLRNQLPSLGKFVWGKREFYTTDELFEVLER